MCRSTYNDLTAPKRMGAHTAICRTGGTPQGSSLALCHLHGGGREGKFAPGVFHGLHNQQVQAVALLQIVGVGQGGQVDAHQNIQAVIVELVQRHGYTVGLHGGLALQKLRQILCYALNLFLGRVVGQPQGELPQAAGALVGILDILGADLGVFYRDNDIVRIADAG